MWNFIKRQQYFFILFLVVIIVLFWNLIDKHNWMATLYNEVVEKPIAFSALFISVLALLASLVDNYYKRQNYRLSTRPYLILSSDLDMLNKTIEFKIYNKGLGPAILEQFSIQHINGKIFTHPTTEQFQEILDLTGFHFKDRTVVTPYLAMAISAGEEFALTRLKSDDFNNQTSLEIQNKFREIRLVVKYRSIYNEMFEFENPLCWI